LRKNTPLVIPKPALSARNLLVASSETSDSSRDNPALRNDNPLGIVQTAPLPFLLAAGAFFRGLLGVFGVSAGFGEIAVRGFQQWVLIAMSELSLHGSIAGGRLWSILLYRAFAAVLIIGESRIQIVF
jgi:hypothetical protein